MSEPGTTKALSICATLLSLQACGGLNEAQIKAGQDACANHGGVKWHLVSFESTDVDVWCMDNTKITSELQP